MTNGEAFPRRGTPFEQPQLTVSGNTSQPVEGPVAMFYSRLPEFDYMSAKEVIETLKKETSMSEQDERNLKGATVDRAAGKTYGDDRLKAHPLRERELPAEYDEIEGDEL